MAEFGEESEEMEEAKTCCGNRSEVGAVAAAELNAEKEPFVAMAEIGIEES